MITLSGFTSNLMEKSFSEITNKASCMLPLTANFDLNFPRCQGAFFCHSCLYKEWLSNKIFCLTIEKIGQVYYQTDIIIKPMSEHNEI